MPVLALTGSASFAASGELLAVGVPLFTGAAAVPGSEWADAVRAERVATERTRRRRDAELLLLA